MCVLTQHSEMDAEGNLSLVGEVLYSMKSPRTWWHQAGSAYYTCLKGLKDSFVDGMRHAKIIRIDDQQSLIL